MKNKPEYEKAVSCDTAFFCLSIEKTPPRPFETICSASENSGETSSASFMMSHGTRAATGDSSISASHILRRKLSFRKRLFSLRRKIRPVHNTGMNIKSGKSIDFPDFQSYLTFLSAGSADKRKNSATESAVITAPVTDRYSAPNIIGNKEKTKAIIQKLCAASFVFFDGKIRKRTIAGTRRTEKTAQKSGPTFAYPIGVGSK